MLLNLAAAFLKLCFASRARDDAKENEDMTEEERILAFAKAKKIMSLNNSSNP